MKAVKFGGMFITDPSKSPDDQIKSINALEMDIKFPKKKAKKEKPGQRIAICIDNAWSNAPAIVKALKALNPKTIDFVITGMGSLDKIAIAYAKELGILVYSAHPYHMGKAIHYHISNSKLFQVFKPTLVLSFNKHEPLPLEVIAQKKGIPVEVIKK